MTSDPKTVLLVDDSDIVLRTFVHALKFHGYNSSAFTSAKEALSAIEAGETFSLAIIDYMMPEMNGLELIAKLKNIAPKMPAILCTGFKDTLDCDEAIEAGANRVIWKPVPIAELMSQVNSMVALVEE